MANYVQVFRAKVRPERAAALTEIRPKAIAEARAACPELLHAELVRVDDDTWLDILTWSRSDGEQVFMTRAGGLTAVTEMHSMMERVEDVRIGEVIHTTRT